MTRFTSTASCEGNEFYSTKKLGAFGSDLGAVACFFETPWSRVSPALTEADQAWLLNEAAFRLRALGRLTEALEPMRAGLEMRIKQEDWKSAAISASNLSELELTLGEVAGAVGDAEQSVTYADRSGDAFQRMVNAHDPCRRPAPGGPPGRGGGALPRGRADAGRAPARLPAAVFAAGLPVLRPALDGGGARRVADSCAAVTNVGSQEMQIWPTAAAPSPSARRRRSSGLSRTAAGSSTSPSTTSPWAAPRSTRRFWNGSSDFDALPRVRNRQHAVAGLRRAGSKIDLPRGLLTRAWLRFLTGARTGPESAQSDLDEAWEIAERGPMKLFMADIHLHRARLFFREAEYPWGSPPPISPPRASSSRNAATGGGRRSWRMPSGRLAGAELNPLLTAYPLAGFVVVRPDSHAASGQWSPVGFSGRVRRAACGRQHPDLRQCIGLPFALYHHHPILGPGGEVIQTVKRFTVREVGLAELVAARRSASWA